MKDFNYCIWFIPENNEWHDLTNGFIPHMTIKHSLSYSDAFRLYKIINTKPIEIELDNPEIHEENGFFAYYYNLKSINNKSLWWPKDQHISFIYKYNEPITLVEQQNIKKNIVNYKGKLTKIALVNCNGHFINWKILLKK